MVYRTKSKQFFYWQEATKDEKYQALLKRGLLTMQRKKALVKWKDSIEHDFRILGPVA